MAVEKFTYRQLDIVLSHLGFTRQQAEFKNRQWLCYEHDEAKAEIILVKKKPNESVLITDALAARRQIIDNGLADEQELDRMLADKVTRENLSTAESRPT